LSQFAQGLFLVLFIAFVVRRLGGDGAAVGLIRGMQAIGGVLGGIVIGRLARRAPPGQLMGWGYIGMGTIGLVTWNAPRLTTAIPLYVALFIAAGVPAVACSVGLMSAAQQFTPSQHLGQLVGTVEAVSAAGVALGTLAAGVLVDHVRVDRLLDGQAAVYLLCGTIAVTYVNRSSEDPRAEPAGGREARQ
jgi:MFS family permease